jgi:hypothetical protein
MNHIFLLMLVLTTLAVTGCKKQLTPEGLADVQAGSRIWATQPDFDAEFRRACAGKSNCAALPAYFANFSTEFGVDPMKLSRMTACVDLDLMTAVKGPPLRTTTIGWAQAASIVSKCAAEEQVTVDLSDHLVEVVARAGADGARSSLAAQAIPVTALGPFPGQ